MAVELSNAMRKRFLVLSFILYATGYCGGPLIMRFYFNHGGKRLWLSTWLQSGGWPIILIPLLLSYFRRRKTGRQDTKLIVMQCPLFFAALMLGVVSVLSGIFYSFGVANLPVSTAVLISSTQLVFIAIFSFVIVKQKFTKYTINAIVLLTLGVAVLALRASGDRPKGESNKMYAIGFAMAIAAAASTGLFSPLVELTYKKAKQTISPTLLLETQLVMSFTATVGATVGMLINNDFKVIPREAREFDLGELKYYVVLVSSAIIWQFSILGSTGIIFSASALVSGILGTILLPVSEVLAVFFFHDKFKVEKGLSLVLCLWGFLSHFYGEMQNGEEKVKPQESEMTSLDVGSEKGKPPESEMTFLDVVP